MALSGLDIYKLLPKTNCRECGFATCLAFAMQLAKKAASLDKCPYISKEAKAQLEASSLPPIRLVTIGKGENKLEVGNETVLFRHEEKFHHPTGIGFILEDNLSSQDLKRALGDIDKLKFQRIGQDLTVNLVALKNSSGNKNMFLDCLKTVLENSHLGLVLMSKDAAVLREAIELSYERRPLVYAATNDNYQELCEVCKKYNLPLVALAKDTEILSGLTQELNSRGLSDLVLDTGLKPIYEKLWDLTQIRRLSLKKNYRPLGYPMMVVIENSDPYLAVSEVAAYIAKYASIVLLKAREPWQVLALLTLRQNIYTDPQKPLQVEAKDYPISRPNEDSPVLVTTNFSLTYYTVLSEVESSKVPSYLVSIDTEGMSVLTAWAAEKFTPDKIIEGLNKCGIKDRVRHKRLIIPGYVAVMSGELEEKSGYEVVVGPREAAGIPSFLKNL